LLTASHDPATWSLSLQLGRNAVKLGVEARTDRIHGGDDDNRDAGSDQAIFNGRCARLVFEKRKNARH
jgi:hypothetical protein